MRTSEVITRNGMVYKWIRMVYDYYYCLIIYIDQHYGGEQKKNMIPCFHDEMRCEYRDKCECI